MKALKITAFIVGGVLVLGALLLVLALTPSVQTWAVRKAVAGQPGLKLDVSRVAAGFSTAELSDVHVVKDGLVISAKHVMAKYSAWDYLSHHRITVNDLAVEDLVIDARNPAPAPNGASTAGNPNAPKSSTASSSAPSKSGSSFNGILGQAQLPFDVQIARFSIPGRALLPNDQTAVFELRGSDITTGQRGTVDWKVDLTNAQANSPVRALHTSGTAHLHITTERRIDVLEVNAVASAEGAKLPADQVKLEAKAEQPAAGGNEGYTANLALVRGGNAEPLLTLAGQYNAASHEIAGAWNVTVRSEQVAALLTGLGLPDVAAEGAGKFSAQPDTGAAKANGELRADIAHLEKISPELATIGSLRVQTKFDGGIANNVAQLEQFALDATAANGRKLAEVTALQRIGYALDTKRVSFADAKADLARINVQALPLAWAQPFLKGLTIDSGEVSMVLAMAAEADGSHVRVRAVEPLLVKDVTIRNGNQKLADRVTLSVKPQADYSPDHLTAELNDLAVTMPSGDALNGRLTADITQLSKSPSIAFTSETQAKLVAALKPYLNVNTGPLTIASKSAGTMAGQTLHFERSSTQVRRESGALLAAVELQQPLTFNLQTNAIAAPKPDADVLRIQLGEIPLSWGEAFVPNSQFAGQVAGGTLGVVVHSIDYLTATVSEPISVRGISVTMNNRPMLQNVDVAVDLTATKKGDVVAYNVRRLEARQGAVSLVKVAVAGETKLGAKPAISAKGTLDADLAALLQQPVAAGSASLGKGTVNATFDAKITDTIDAKAVVMARNLTARDSNQPLGDAELQVNAMVQPDGSSLLKVPFTFTNGTRKSDVAIEGRIARTENRITFDGRITSNLLVIDDLKPLAGLAPSSSASPAPAASPAPRTSTPAAAPRATRPGSATTPTTTQPSATADSGSSSRDTKAFWSAFGGKVEVDLKQVNYGRDYVISGIRGAAAITPTQLALNGLEGKLKDNPFKLAARIDFAAAQPQPYTLAATVNVTNFDVGQFLQAANPNEKPQLETKVTVDAKLNGKGNNLDHLALNTYGTFDVTGSQGVLRALGKRGGEVVSGGSALLGLAGALMKPGGSDTTIAVADLTRKLAELPFDKFVMHVERGADLNLKIGHIEFLSPDTRVVGSGGITNQPGVPIQNQPLKVTLSLAGKDNMAFLLNRAGLLNGQQDELGYYTMGTSFTISGTPAKPDSNDLWKIIAEAGIKAAAGRFLGK